MPKGSAPPKKRTRGSGGEQPQELQDLHGRPAKLQNQAASPNAIRMTYRDWLEKANVSTTTTTTTTTTTMAHVGPNDEHWYFRLVGCGYLGADGGCDKGSSEYLFDELPYLQPVNDTLYMVNGDEQKGIHCRFGMQGVLAEVSDLKDDFFYSCDDLWRDLCVLCRKVMDCMDATRAIGRV
jgi:hypothetical protein